METTHGIIDRFINFHIRDSNTLVFANLIFKLNHKFWIWRKEKKVQKADDSKRGPELKFLIHPGVSCSNFFDILSLYQSPTETVRKDF